MLEIIESLKEIIIELRNEKYQSEKNGLAKTAIELINILEKEINNNKGL
jgi:hypothetical protein